MQNNVYYGESMQLEAIEVFVHVNEGVYGWQDAVVIGGLDMHLQAKALAKRPHVVVATPGRLRVGLHLSPNCPMTTVIFPPSLSEALGSSSRRSPDRLFLTPYVAEMSNRGGAGPDTEWGWVARMLQAREVPGAG